MAGGSQWPPFFPQDLKPGNLAVNEDCELKVSLGGEGDQDGGWGGWGPLLSLYWSVWLLAQEKGQTSGI